MNFRATSTSLDCDGGYFHLFMHFSDTYWCEFPDCALLTVHTLPFGSSAVCFIFFNVAISLLRRISVLFLWGYACSDAIPIQIPVLSARLWAHHVSAVGRSTSMFALYTSRVANSVLICRDVSALVRSIVDQYSAYGLQDSLWFYARSHAILIQSPVLSYHLGAQFWAPWATLRPRSLCTRRASPITCCSAATLLLWSSPFFKEYSSEDLQDFDELFSVFPKLVLFLKLIFLQYIRILRYVTGNDNFFGLLLSNYTRFWNPLSTKVTEAPRSLHFSYPAFSTDLTGSVTIIHLL